MNRIVLIALSFCFLKLAYAEGDLDYQIKMDFGSQEICRAVAEGIDIKEKSFESHLVVSGRKCIGSVLIGKISAGPNVKSASMRVVFTTSATLSCDAIFKFFREANPSLNNTNCIEHPLFGRAEADFNYPLSGGQEITAIQSKHTQEFEEMRAQTDFETDKAFCEKSAKAGHPCKWFKDESNPAVSDQQSAQRKQTRQTGADQRAEVPSATDAKK